MKKKAVKQWLYVLKINKVIIKYSVKFQCIAVLMNWDNNVLIL